MATATYLHGYRFSVYNRIARMALLLKSVAHETVEVDPFTNLTDAYLALNPFGRVPTLIHGELEIFETNAITRFVDRAFEGLPLQPHRLTALARMDQVIAVIDAYAYWPMVRQVASHAFFRPLVGEPSNREEIEIGLKASGTVLSFLNRVAAEGEILTGREISLADCHLAPMVDYFVKAEEGRAAIAAHPALEKWWEQASALDALKFCNPFSDGAASAKG
jgi:glutathione S-transferase